MFPYFRTSKCAALLRDLAAGTVAGWSFVGIPLVVARLMGRI